MFFYVWQELCEKLFARVDVHHLPVEGVVVLVLGEFVIGHAHVFRAGKASVYHSQSSSIHAESLDGGHVPLSVKFEYLDDVEEEEFVARHVDADVAVGVIEVDVPVVISAARCDSVEIGVGGEFVVRREIIVAASGLGVGGVVVAIDDTTLVVDLVRMEPTPAVADHFLPDALLFFLSKFQVERTPWDTVLVEDEAACGRLDDDDGFESVVVAKVAGCQ